LYVGKVEFQGFVSRATRDCKAERNKVINYAPKEIIMPKYRKKPIVIEAIQYTSKNGWTFRAWSDAAVMENPTGESLEIKTLR